MDELPEELFTVAFFGAAFLLADDLDEEEPLRLADEPVFVALRPLPDDFLAALFLGADFFEAPFLLAAFFDAPPREDEPLEDPPREFLEAAFLLAPLLEDFDAAFFAIGLLAALFLAPLFLAELFLEAVLLEAPFLLATFEELLLPEVELRFEDEDPRPDAFLAALFLAGAFDEDLPPEDLLPPFFAAAFLVDFAILIWDLMRVNKFSFLKLR